MKCLRHKAAFAAFAFVLVVVVTGCGSSSASPTATPIPRPTATPAALSLITSGHLTVGTDADYAPMESTNPQTSTYVGADIDLASALAKAMGLQSVTYVDKYFNELATGLTEKKFDVIISAMTDTSQRRSTMGFVDYMRSSQAIVVKKSSSIYANSYAQLCGKSVAVQSATTELEGLTAANAHCSSPISIHQFAANPEAFATFKQGKTQAYTADGPVADSYIAHDSSLVLAGKPFDTGLNYGIAFLPTNTALQESLQRALTEIRKSGEYAHILSRWGVSGSAI
jgi:polar amino acid transport system substrate-binding protein